MQRDRVFKKARKGLKVEDAHGENIRKRCASKVDTQFTSSIQYFPIRLFEIQTRKKSGGNRGRKESRMKVGLNSQRIIKMGREINLRQARKIVGYRQNLRLEQLYE